MGHLQGTANKELYVEITLLQAWNWAREQHQQLQGLKKRHMLTAVPLIRFEAGCWTISSSSLPRRLLVFVNLSAFHPPVWDTHRGCCKVSSVFVSHCPFFSQVPTYLLLNLLIHVSSFLAATSSTTPQKPQPSYHSRPSWSHFLPQSLTKTCQLWLLFLSPLYC